MDTNATLHLLNFCYPAHVKAKRLDTTYIKERTAFQKVLEIDWPLWTDVTKRLFHLTPYKIEIWQGVAHWE
jgi:hypothetical protein